MTPELADTRQAGTSENCKSNLKIGESNPLANQGPLACIEHSHHLFTIYFGSKFAWVTFRFRGTSSNVKVLGENCLITYKIMIWDKHGTNVVTIHLL